MTQLLQHWIGGNEYESERTIERAAPATGELLSRASAGGQKEIALAISAASVALKRWASLSVGERAKFLLRMADWLSREYGEAGKASRVKNLISTEVGKPLAEADVEVIETSDFIRYFAESAPNALADEHPQLDQSLWPSKTSTVKFVSRGVIAIIKPWNYPLEMIAWSLAPALLAGNTVIIKPSEKSPLTASLFREMAEAVSLPQGVLNIVYGDAETGKLIGDANGIDFISFTGSTMAGRDLAGRCAKKLRPYSLELGGNDAAIVLEDVDLELAANGLAWGAFCNAGQVCVGTKRAFVAQTIFEQIALRVAQIAQGLRIGTDLGPIIDEKQILHVEELVDDAIQKGARALAGGHRLKTKRGYYFAPTVLVDVPFNARLNIEECFGPVLPLFSFSSSAEAISRANDSLYGLGASIWTSNLAEGQKLAEQIQAGMIWINDVNVAFPQAPWGGFKRSGVGFELSADALREYSLRKHLNTETSGELRRSWWYPY